MKIITKLTSFTLLAYDCDTKSNIYCTGFPPEPIMTFDFTGIDIESIKKELPLKKRELDSKYNVDPQKSSIRIDDDASNKQA
jgi:hypothetical protein